MRATVKRAANAIAFFALRGRVAYIPEELPVADVLNAIPDLGGIDLTETGEEIARRATQYCGDGSRVSYIVVNTTDGDIQVSLILDTPEIRVQSEDDLLARDGYVLAYVWNATAPWCSEMGDIYLERGADGAIHRRG